MKKLTIVASYYFYYQKNQIKTNKQKTKINKQINQPTKKQPQTPQNI